MMKENVEPGRLAASSVPLVAAVVRAGRTDVPDAARMNALSLGLAGKLGVLAGGGAGGAGAGGGAAGGATGGGGTSGAAAGATGVATTTAFTKAVVVSLATGALALGGAGWWASRPATRPEVAPLAMANPAVDPPPASIAAPVPEAPRAPAPAPSVEAPAVSAASSTSTIPASKRPASSTGVSPSASLAAADRSAAEMELLRRAQTELSRKPDAALSLCAEHERRFPSGAFSEEREVIAIDALSRLGRRAEASARGERFLASHPRSGHRPRVEALLNQP